MSLFRTWSLFRRELGGYFRSPIGLVFLTIFVLAAHGYTFFIGKFLEGNQAILGTLFHGLPWLFLFFIPAVGMRLWSEEFRLGTYQILSTLPLHMGEAVAGKFLAAWVFIGIALGFTVSLVITVGYLGEPDVGALLCGYLGSFLLAGGYLAIGALISALSESQVAAYALSSLTCFVFLLLGWDVFAEFLAYYLPASVVQGVALMGFIPHFDPIARGVVDSRNVIYFGSIMVLGFLGTAVVLERRGAS